MTPRPSIELQMRAPLVLLVVVPVVLGALVLTLSVMSERETSVVTNTLTPFSIAVLKLAEESQALSIEFESIPTTKQAAESQQARVTNILRKIGRALHQQSLAVALKSNGPTWSSKLDGTLKSIERKSAAYFDETAVGIAQKLEIEAGLTAVRVATKASEKIIEPAVHDLADASQRTPQGNVVNAFAEVEDLIEMAGVMRTTRANFERMAAATTAEELKRVRQPVMLDIRTATRLAARAKDPVAAKTFSTSTGTLFYQATEKSGVWGASFDNVELNARLTEKRQGILLTTTALVGQLREAVLGAEQKLESARKRGETLRWLTVGGLIAMVLSSLGIAFYWRRVLKRDVLSPIHVLRDTTLALSNGDLSVTIGDGRTQELHELAEALEGFRAAAMALKRSNADLEQFATVASHDLQSPLREVSNYLGVVQVRLGDGIDERSQGFIEKAIDGAQRMQQMIEDLLSFSTAGDAPPRSFDMTTVFRALQREHAMSDEEVEFERDIVIHGIQLDRLMANLWSNAVKFAKPNERPRVAIDVDLSSSESVIRFRDFGIGIEPTHRSRVFELFKRLHRRGEIPGQGIGLAICERICERNRGSISIVDTDGDGTTFEIRLPST